MLWTDGPFVTIDDLMRIDSEVAQVAKDEKISLTGNYGMIRGALEEASQEMLKMAVAFGGYISSGSLSPNHTAAVLNTGLGNSVRQRISLSQLVVSGNDQYTWNHIKHWAVHFCLQYFYRDVFNRTVKDRYEGKMRFYKSELDRRISGNMKTLGLPLIIQPLARPAATWERSPVDYNDSLIANLANVSWTTSGSWSNENLSTASHIGAVGGSFSVVVTYVCQGVPVPNGTFKQDYTKYVSSSRDGNAESAPSEKATIDVPADSVIHVDIGSLNPPSGIQDPMRRVNTVIPVLAATGWNVYVGPVNGELRLQNAAPIVIGTETYTLAADPTTTGIVAGVGQVADRIMSLNAVRQRG